jgi:hypothetical protein
MKGREFDVSSRPQDRAGGQPAATEKTDDRARILSLHRQARCAPPLLDWAEPAGVTIKSLDDCVLGFDLGPKATHGDALRVAEFLNQNILATECAPLALSFGQS